MPRNAAPEPGRNESEKKISRQTLGGFLSLALAGFAILATSAPSIRAAESLVISWATNMLTIRGADIPGGPVEVWYLEAFCRPGGWKRAWSETTVPHKTDLLTADKDGHRLQLRTRVEPDVEILHDIRAGADEIDFRLSAKNNGQEFATVEWFQPCMRVARFTGGNQSNYVSRCFIFTGRGLTLLDQTRRTEEALYRGGQVYVPAGINLDDVNPRPISPEQPVNGLIGCFSADGTRLLAMAWGSTEELFQGVIVCLHNDPRLGGLKPGETKKLHGKIYLLKNDPQALLARYRRDFRER